MRRSDAGAVQAYSLGVLKIVPVVANKGKSTASAAATSAAGTGRDLSAMTGLLNDPIIKESAEQIAKGPAFNKMAEQLLQTFHGATVDEAQFDTQTYYNTMQQVMHNPQFMTMAECPGTALTQELAL